MSKRTQRKESAFEAGRKARRDNMEKKDNPYKDALRIVWLAGFMSPKVKIKKTFDKIKSKLPVRTNTEKNRARNLRRRLET